MANGLAAFAVGLGSGYLTAQQRGRDQERQSRLDAQNSELHGLRMDEANAAKNLRMGLADAVKPAALNESAPTLAMADGTKTAYDNADTAGSDFRQLRRNDEATGQQTLARATLADGVNLSTAQPVKPALGGLASMSQTGGLEPRQAPTASELQQALPEPTTGDSLPPGVGLANKKQDNSVALAPQGLPSVNGKSYSSLADARQAKTAYDLPEAQAARQAAVYSSAGQSDKGSQIQVDQMRLAQMKQEVSDKAVSRKISGLQTPEAIAQFISDYPHDGQGGALKTEAVHSADGKSWGMVVVNPDGTRKPIPGDFSNDADGITEAHIKLLSQLKPEMRVEMYKWDQELTRKVKADANTARHQGVLEGAAITTAEAAKIRAEKSGAPAAPAGYRYKADGVLEAIPGGPATIPKPLNDNQSKALLFGSRMQEADKILEQLASEGTSTSVPGSRTPGLGPVITAMSSENKQMLDQAKRDFMSAVLRRESGAAISSGEYENADRQYFPQIGDNAKVIAQKASNRKIALNGILMEVPEAQRNSLSRQAPTDAASTPKPPAAQKPLPMPKTVTEMQVGDIYNTGRGPAKWNGKTFEAQ